MPGPSPADLLPGWAAGVSEVLPLVHEVSRRAWGVSTLPDGIRTRAITPAHVAFRTYQPRGVRIVCFHTSIAHPRRYPRYPRLRFIVSLAVAAQETRGRVDRYFFPRKNFPFSASCPRNFTHEPGWRSQTPPEAGQIKGKSCSYLRWSERGSAAAATSG
jgi:hypothetical protein